MSHPVYKEGMFVMVHDFHPVTEAPVKLLAKIIKISKAGCVVRKEGDPIEVNSVMRYPAYYYNNVSPIQADDVPGFLAR